MTGPSSGIVVGGWLVEEDVGFALLVVVGFGVVVGGVLEGDFDVLDDVGVLDVVDCPIW